jgi:hypothetical protein
MTPTQLRNVPGGNRTLDLQVVASYFTDSAVLAYKTNISQCNTVVSKVCGRPAGSGEWDIP